jgi:N-dimethylarginine dimethylaminohydrolase
VKKGLHLKSSVTMFNDQTIIVGTSEASQFIKKQIQEKSRFKYNFIDVDDENYAGSANVLYFNKCLAVPSHLLKIYENFPEFKGMNEIKPLPNRELFKIDGCLTCRSVFFSSGK